MTNPCDENKTRTLALLEAYRQGDLNAIERLLAPSFTNLRKPSEEMSRYAYLDALRMLFQQWQDCSLTVHRLTAEGDAVAMELSIAITLQDRRLDFERHDLLIFEGGLLVAVHEYDTGGRPH